MRHSLILACALCAALVYPCKSDALSATTLADGTEVRFGVDFIFGAFDDRALYVSGGCEKQMFKAARGVLALDVQRPDGSGALVEYNILPDEPKRVDGNAFYNDYYKNIGTDLYYYGDFKVKNAYLRYGKGAWQLRAGRMVNPYGFAEHEVPYWGRNDSPHGRYLDKEILNGVAFLYDGAWLMTSAAVLSGRGRPDSGYNWYLKGQTDPNIKGNNTPIVEAQARLKWEDYLWIGAGLHTNKTGSAPGTIYAGKHNDWRMNVHARSLIPVSAYGVDELLFLGQISRYTVGLTEDGVQGITTPEASLDIQKDGWFATAGIGLVGWLHLYVTFEELDRADTKVWKEIANYERGHWAMSTRERSRIFQADARLNDWVTLSVFYRKIDAPFPELSGITEPHYSQHGTDKFGITLRARL